MGVDSNESANVGMGNIGFVDLSNSFRIVVLVEVSASSQIKLSVSRIRAQHTKAKT